MFSFACFMQYIFSTDDQVMMHRMCLVKKSAELSFRFFRWPWVSFGSLDHGASDNACQLCWFGGRLVCRFFCMSRQNIYCHKNLSFGLLVSKLHKCVNIASDSSPTSVFWLSSRCLNGYDNNAESGYYCWSTTGNRDVTWKLYCSHEILFFNLYSN